MDVDKMALRIDELTEELGNIPLDQSSKRENIVEEINTLGRLYLEAEKSEINRINSNIQNDLNQDRLDLEVEKMKAEKANSRRELAGNIIKTVGSLVGSIGLAVVSFRGEWLMNILKDRTIWDIAKSMKPRN